MIQTKLTKLARRLKIFTFEEFLIMSGEEEQTVKTFLDELLTKERIEKNRQNSYKYIELVPTAQINALKTKFMNGTYFSPAEIKNLEDERNTLESYINAPEHIKKMVDKYLAVLKECNNARGNALYRFINDDWNKKHPDIRTSISAFSRTKRLLKNYGVAGLISPCMNAFTIINRIDEDIYSECKEYILKHKDKSIRYNYVKFKSEYLRKHPDLADHEFPGYWSFTARIKKDILKLNDSELAKIYQEKKQGKIIQKKCGFKTFQSAAEDFLKDVLEKNEVGKCVVNQHKRNINKHLIPYFKTMKLSQINEIELEKYRIFMNEQQLSSVKVREQLNLIKNILKIYAYEVCPSSIIKKINSEFINETNILEEKQIKHLLSLCKKEFKEFYPMLVTVINAGLTRGEVLALTWNKFDHENKKLQIDKSICNGRILLFGKRHARRNIDLPDKLIKILLHLKKLKQPIDTDFIFPDENGDFQDPEKMTNENFMPLITKAGIKNIKFIDLKDTTTVLLIKQNLPLTYIREQLGFNNIKDFVDKYQKYIPEIAREKFCLI